MAAKSPPLNMSAPHLLGALLLLALGWTPRSSRADESALNKTYREVRLYILTVDGQPAPHRTIYIRGWVDHQYGCLGPTNDNQNTCGWPYATDANGNVTVRVGDFKAPIGSNEPDWGTYAALVNPTADDAGAISTRFWIGAPPPDELGEKEWGKTVPVPPAGLDLTVQIHRGVTISGRVVDADHHDKPLAGVCVSTLNDLVIGTRTGYPGYVFARSATTDKKGRFVLPHLFPINLWLDVSPVRSGTGNHSNGALWTQTLVDGQWQPAASHFASLLQDSTVNFEMAAIPNPAFHYTGTVTDPAGSPVAGANVDIGYYDNPQRMGNFWCDRAGGKTKADGTYDIVVPSPWVSGMTADDPHNNRMYANLMNDLQPGQHDFVLTPDGHPLNARPPAAK